MSPRLPHITYEEDEEAPAGEAPPPSSSFRCHDCGKLSPPTRTGETLVSSRHGWRAERVQVDADRARVDWRCPACWTTHRAEKLSSF